MGALLQCGLWGAGLDGILESGGGGPAACTCWCAFCSTIPARGSCPVEDRARADHLRTYLATAGSGPAPHLSSPFASGAARRCISRVAQSTCLPCLAADLPGPGNHDGRELSAHACPPAPGNRPAVVAPEPAALAGSSALSPDASYGSGGLHRSLALGMAAGALRGGPSRPLGASRSPSTLAQNQSGRLVWSPA